MSTTTDRPVQGSGTFSLGGELRVHRLGFGAMRLTGEGIWGPPADHDNALAVLRRAVDLGVDLVDTADAYGPFVSEDLIAEALHPYPQDLVIATKVGLVRTGPGQWHPVGRPEYLRQAVEMSLRRLRLEAIPVMQLHRPDPAVPFEDQVGLLADMAGEGKIRHVALSNVDVEQIEAARRLVPIVSVQNRYNLSDRQSEPVLEHCRAQGIGFIPWAPIAGGEAAEPGGALDAVSAETGASHSQVALSWLLAHSPVMLPIPGTASQDHLEQNCAAAALSLTADQMARLDGAAG